MTIDPEIIPSKSNEGINAIKLSNDWYYYLALSVFFMVIVIVLKVLFEAILISLGIIFIWRLATS